MAVLRKAQYKKTHKEIEYLQPHLKDVDLFLFRELCINIIRSLEIEELQKIFNIKKTDKLDEIANSNSIPTHMKKELSRRFKDSEILYEVELVIGEDE